jgi:uncharacterized protein (DUF433 family)
MSTPTVTKNPEIMHGTPCFAGTRVPVRNLFDLLTHNRTLAYFLEQFPTVTREQALAVLDESCRRPESDAPVVGRTSGTT